VIYLVIEKICIIFDLGKRCEKENIFLVTVLIGIVIIILTYYRALFEKLL
jgi:hypothetical protein